MANKVSDDLVLIARAWMKTRDDFSDKQRRNQSLSIGGLDPTLARQFTDALEGFSNQAIVVLGINTKVTMMALVEVLSNAAHQLPD